MSAWRNWGISAWNERLLNHFFRSDVDDPPPVATLLATADEIARAVGAPESDADAAREAFVNAVVVGIRSSKSLLEDATNYEGWPNAPHWTSRPRFVAHLVFTCVAASESSDELGDEGSYVSRLRQLTSDQLPYNSLHSLPKLWENLGTWLTSNRGRYRQLVLPNPGGLTRIGYSARLAFPDRRDQRELSALLACAGVSGREPPVDVVIRLIAAEKRRFRTPFVTAFEEFRRLRSEPTSTTNCLREHRLWAAVVEAALRGRAGTATVGIAQVTLLGEEVEDRLSLFLVSDAPLVGSEIQSRELPSCYGLWRFGATASGSEETADPDYETPVRACLAGTLRLRPLSDAISQGLLPFVRATHGLLELTGRKGLDECEYALVRNPMIDDLKKLFPGKLGEVRESPYPEWMQLRSPRLHTVPEKMLENTTLDHTWILQESITGGSLKIVGGIRTESGWLGAREVLPTISCPDATSVAVASAVGPVLLTPEGPGRWRLPVQDMEGEYSVAVVRDGRENVRKVHFHRAPVDTAYKPPSDPEAWLVEAMDSTVTMLEAEPCVSDENREDLARFFERRLRLGPDVGDFVQEPVDAAWEITQFAGKYFGERGRLRGVAASPRNRSSNANGCRRWRKMVFNSTPSANDLEFADARRSVKATATRGDLPVRDIAGPSIGFALVKGQQPAPNTYRLVDILAGIAANRAGIPLPEWRKLVQAVLNVSWSMAEMCTRAWLEAGLIDVASRARWRQVAVFARRPRILLFRVGSGVGGVLSGLALKSTIGQVGESASQIGVTVEDRLSKSAYVPSTVALSASTESYMREIASECGIETEWLDPRALHRELTRPRPATNPPARYDRVSKSDTWSVRQGNRDGVDFDFCTTPNKPDFWIVTRGGQRLWSYEKNVVRACAAMLLDEPIIVTSGDFDLEAHHAFLPLPLARIASVLGAARPGPVDGKYCYPLAVVSGR